ncbi:hypothetical protein EF808_04930 [archaeon]|nr:MAG: hypothetical protein EF808_04930 [archaeon]
MSERAHVAGLCIAVLLLLAPCATFAQDANDYEFTSDTEIVTSNGWTHELTYLADYTVSGTVVGIAYYDEETTVFSPMDVAIAWGDMEDPRALDSLTVTMGDRRLTYQWRSVGDTFSQEYVTSHISNTHVIPRTPGIYEECMSLKVGDQVSLSGRLVDVDGTKREGTHIYHSHWGPSSTSVHDTGDGACEILVVEGIDMMGPETYEETHERTPVVEQIRTHRAVCTAISWKIGYEGPYMPAVAFPRGGVRLGARLTP